MTDRTSHLAELLFEFPSADENEAANVHRFTRLLATAANPFSRVHFEPGHVTASAFVVNPPTARILLHHHRRLNRWLQMGGHVDPDERVTEAALREASEESGLGDLRLFRKKPFDIDVHVIPEGKGEPQHLHFDVRFIVATMTPDAATIAHDESIELAWFDLDEAERRMNAPESTRALEKIRRLLSSTGSISQ